MEHVHIHTILSNLNERLEMLEKKGCMLGGRKYRNITGDVLPGKDTYGVAHSDQPKRQFVETVTGEPKRRFLIDLVKKYMEGMEYNIELDPYRKSAVLYTAGFKNKAEIRQFLDVHKNTLIGIALDRDFVSIVNKAVLDNCKIPGDKDMVQESVVNLIRRDQEHYLS
jgi:hypothetical protein